jgi:murein DD-endopeptidase MepM/ murein hydrolase activator NlpD
LGETKEKGIVIGLSGTTGMAGGDHLHFSILVNGIFVNPVEWWDKQWISLNVDEILYSRKSLNRPF